MRASRHNLVALGVLAAGITLVIGKPDAGRGGFAGTGAATARATRSGDTRPVRFDPPAGAATNADWLAFGAYEDWFYLRPSNWCMRAANGGWIESLRIFSFGGVSARTEDGATSGWPPPFPGKFSLAPCANWSMLSSGGAGGSPESLFWHLFTPSNTLLLTWQDALYARSHTNLVSFQAELFADGGYAYRYSAGVAAEDFTLRAVLPFDVDGDGLENSVDPEPAAAGPDAHGTGGEWFETVCRGISNSNAYYFVETVAARGPAPIWFKADRESALGSPAVVALAGETNRVPLLIGAEYEVSSDSPFSLFAPDCGYARVVTNGAASYTVKWPLEFERFEDGGGCTVVPWPVDPGGVWEWDGPGARQGGSAPRLLSAGADGCGCMSANGNRVTYRCTTPAFCDGTCAMTGRYSYEGASFSVTGGVCRCWNPHGDDPPWEDDDSPDPSGVYAGARFTEPVVFYEESYTNAPGEVVARRATRTTLEIEAGAGDEGAILCVEAEGIERFRRVGGEDIVFPFWRMLAPGETDAHSVEYEPLAHSGSEGDIRVSVRIKRPGGATRAAIASATAAKVQLTALAMEPENQSRHVYGVREEFVCETVPLIAGTTWRSDCRLAMGGTTAAPTFVCPLSADAGTVDVFAGGSTYSAYISVIEPAGVLAGDAVALDFGIPAGCAGGAGMAMQLYILPAYVSFARIAMQEIPSLSGTHSGYFADPEWSGAWYHTRERGAGQWANIHPGNEFIMDCAQMGDILDFPWSDGNIVWFIPLAWNEMNTTGDTPPARTSSISYEQMFSLSANGTLGVGKLGNTVERGTNDWIFVNGERVK